MELDISLKVTWGFIYRARQSFMEASEEIFAILQYFIKTILIFSAVKVFRLWLSKT